MGQTRISAGACILLAAMLLLLPLKWIAAAFLAAFVHEYFHWAAIILCSRQAPSVRLFAFGARMPMPPMHPARELLCALAGPLGGLVLLLFARWLPRTAVCAAFQSIYNLLPIYPMDGGRAFRCALQLITDQETAEKICRWIEYLCISALFLLGIYGTIRLRLGFFPVILAGFLLLRIKISKTPCKVGTFRVQ